MVEIFFYLTYDNKSYYLSVVISFIFDILRRITTFSERNSTFFEVGHVTSLLKLRVLTSLNVGLVDRMFAVHAGIERGSRWHKSERFFRSNRPGYPHPVCFELENSGIRVAVGDCRVTERRL